MNDLEKEVLRYIGENVDSPDVFSDITQIRDSINDAIEEIAITTGCYTEKYTIPLYEGQGIYLIEFSRGTFGFPIDVFTRNDNRRLEQTDLIKLNMTNPGWLHNNSRPWQYYLIGMDYIGVYPAPSGTGSILDIECVVIPDRYENDNDRIKLREGFKKSVIHYAVGEYYATRGDASSATDHLIDYLKSTGLDGLYSKSNETPLRFSRERSQPINAN